MLEHPAFKWVAFNLFVVVMLLLDLLVFHRKAKRVSVKEALIWTGVWVFLALVFNVGVYHYQGRQKALEFLTGYLIEKSLSVDNIFVFLMIFSYFSVPPKYQHRTLFLGIIGAYIMRALFIAVGVKLILMFHFVIYIFGVFLIVSGIKMAFMKDAEVHPERNPVLRLFRKFFPVTERFEGDRFIVRRDGRLLATPLLVVLVVIETTDVVFALDSIPAILGITHDAFIAYTSNAFAILGLRALYFALAGVMELFHYLHFGLSFVLTFVGVKMVIEGFYPIHIAVALGVVTSTVAVSIVASLMFPPRQKGPPSDDDLPGDENGEPDGDSGE